ncbi:MAG: hypothetical protein WA840_10590 [Caulobacteraceae bacterium]
MKMLITAALATLMLATATSGAEARPWRHHHHWGHRHHRVCTWRHGRRICFMR